MKIIIATMVKDEADITDHWINYHGKIFGYKNIYIIDNMSSDGTYELCLKYKEKFGIHLKRHDNYLEKGNQMTNIMRANNCDIFFPIDIDEFIVFYDRKKKEIKINNIIPYFKKLIQNKGNEYDFFKCDYLNVRKTIDSKNVVKKFGHAHLNEGYSNMRKTFIYTKNVKNIFNIDHGNHMKDVKYYLSDLCLVHYHLRSHKQKYLKSVNNTVGMGFKVNIKKCEKGNKKELKKFEAIKDTGRGKHHAIVLYDFYIKKIKSFEPQLQKYNKNLINISIIYDFLEKIKTEQILRKNRITNPWALNYKTISKKLKK